MSFGFQKAFGFYSRHAARPGRSNGLPVDTVLYVPRMKDARDIGARAALRRDVTIGVGGELAAKDGGIRDMSDRHKKTIDRLIPHLAGLHVAEPGGRDQVLADV